MSDSKPVLWVSLTDAGRASEPTAESLNAVAEDVQQAVGDDYNVVVADDRLRLASEEDLRDLRDTITETLPGEVDTDAEQERYAEMGGLTEDDVETGDGPGVMAAAAGGDQSGDQNDDYAECYECGAVLGEEWQEACDAAKERGDDHPVPCLECGENPMPPVGGGE